MGNREDGLCALYVCFPVRDDAAGRICEWGYTYEILRRLRELEEPSKSREHHPDEVIAEVEVKARQDAGRKPNA